MGEEERMRALNRGDAYNYARLCILEGISPKYVEDLELYMQGLEEFNHRNPPVEEERPAEVVEEPQEFYENFIREHNIRIQSTKPLNRKELLQKHFGRFNPGGKQDITHYTLGQLNELYPRVLDTASKKTGIKIRNF